MCTLCTTCEHMQGKVNTLVLNKSKDIGPSDQEFSSWVRLEQYTLFFVFIIIPIRRRAISKIVLKMCIIEWFCSSPNRRFRQRFRCTRWSNSNDATDWRANTSVVLVELQKYSPVCRGTDVPAVAAYLSVEIVRSFYWNLSYVTNCQLCMNEDKKLFPKGYPPVIRYSSEWSLQIIPSLSE